MNLLPALLTATLLAIPWLSSCQDVALDTDRDGLSDALEQSLLQQFAPTFIVGRDDCSNIPAEFQADFRMPTVRQENGTIYGQVFPTPASTPAHPQAEIHFYHLWKRDCGGHGHPLDTEHVAVLVNESPDGGWSAAYWYAAAHEATVCDVSQITRASTLKAVDHGPNVWISRGKHASYLTEALCRGGCGADRCVNMSPLPPGQVINLGEFSHPMNGSAFVSSTAWPLAAKMKQTNFPPAVLARLKQQSEAGITLYNPGRHPAQGIISNSSATEQKLAAGASNITGALGTAGDATGSALDKTNTSTGNALLKSYRKTRRALGSAVRGTVKAITPAEKAPE